MMADFKGLTPRDFNEKVISDLGGFGTVKHKTLSCLEHPFGFTVSEIEEKDVPSLLELGAAKIDSPTPGVDMYKMEQERKLAHHDIPGVVVYQGEPWMFEKRISYPLTRIFQKIYGNLVGGFGDRDVSMTYYFWAYLGARVSNRARPSIMYENSIGHDLYNQTYADAVLPATQSVTNALCQEAEDMQVSSGDTLTRVMLEFRSPEEIGVAVPKVRAWWLYSVTCHCFALLTWKFSFFHSIQGLVQ